MEISIRHIGHSPVSASKIIEMTVTGWGGNTTIIESVTDLKGKVDENLIIALRKIANELEDQNRLTEENE